MFGHDVMTGGVVVGVVRTAGVVAVATVVVVEGSITFSRLILFIVITGTVECI